MNNFSVIKSITISGNLRQKLVYKFCPNTEFTEGLWSIKIQSIGYVCAIPNFKEICEISCNLVKSQRYNTSFEVEVYNQPFNIFVLETQKTVLNFAAPWLNVNSLSNELQFTISSLRTNQKIEIDCDFYVQCLFQRIK